MCQIQDLFAYWSFYIEQALAELLDIISDPSFVSEDVAPSPYLLEQCDEFFFNCIPTAKLEVRNSDGTKDSLEYHPLEAILEYVLNNEKLMKGRCELQLIVLTTWRLDLKFD